MTPSPTKRSLERIFILAIGLLVSTPAHAYHPKQIEHYVNRVYRQEGGCALRSKLAKEVAEADGYTCQYAIIQTGSQTYHSYLKMEKDGKRYEILR